MLSKTRRSHGVLALLVLLVLPWSTGCSEDESPTVVLTPPDDSLPLVEDGDRGRDQLVANLVAAYVQLNYGMYENLIHPDYVFRMDPAESGIIDTQELSAAEDLNSTFNMFIGETGIEPVLDQNGQPTGASVIVPPVQGIQLDLTAEASSSWTLMEDGLFARTWRRIYDVDMTVTFSGETRVDQIVGKQIFYLIEGTISVDDVDVEVWQIRAWEDQGIS